MAEIILSVLVVAGGVFTLIGSLGLWRMRDFYTRLHGPTKATTLGVGCLLVASSAFFSITGDGLSLHEVLVSLFLFITAPISAHLMTKAALHRHLPSLARLPSTPPISTDSR
ncbi:MAG: Na+/H+ antiporter subunit G [Rhodoferax sp.]|nr:Na+/H+ antiporter subunit G [Betaproteobacteria bacterium]NCN97212.1 Na+/H+ antiporter subunit G [Rhodoferax sp.]OIP15405.1 MAG: Na+/H+ antiporter subunit G [Comamonadaceae bacterium CG2_30_57_122]PIZ23908.1 MAG: Na+/H+ antiporter subunit G [Comamonadaceae bacterium CG_4_10_14_0_8_um_filter_57_29]PJC19721.1 MAG: Na+/H+ antiporter subunit G [Comamonadaceae bacterium CG_4_9_14_0_8_um_filter_57_21]